MKDKLNVTIIGGGNIGTLMAADLSGEANVTVFTSDSSAWNNRIGVYDSNDNQIFLSAPINVTNDLYVATVNADIIFLTVPAFMFENYAKILKKFVSVGQTVCIVPGAGGAEFAFADLISSGINFTGFQRVHSIARIKERGKSVYCLGRKAQIEIASIPSKLSAEFKQIISELFSMPCVSLNNYLCLTLTPSNPILHTSRLYSLFGGYHNGKIYNEIPLFYEEWDDFTSEILIKMDNELQRLCDVIDLDLREVIPLTVYYENNTVSGMTNKIRSIKAFKGLLSPMTAVGNKGFVPDFSSRYFVADFDYGLKIICDICDLFQVKADTLKKVYDWYDKISPYQQRGVFSLKLDRSGFLNMYKS